MPRTKLQGWTQEQSVNDATRRVNAMIVQRMYIAGMTMQDLAERISVNYRTVVDRLDTKHQHAPWKLDELFRVFYTLGITEEEIAQALKVRLS